MAEIVNFIMLISESEIQLIIQEGEGYRIEFKERLTNIDREMVAFANASGDRIFIGITDDGVIRDIDVTNELKSQIQDIANNWDPLVKVLLKTFENLLILEVREGTDKPYKCASGFFNRIVRIPEIKGHPFRELADTGSGNKRTVIPFLGGQSFRK